MTRRVGTEASAGIDHGLRVALWLGEQNVDRLVAGDVPDLVGELAIVDLRCLAAWLICDHAEALPRDQRQGSHDSAKQLEAIARRKRMSSRARGEGSRVVGTRAFLPRRDDLVTGAEGTDR